LSTVQISNLTFSYDGSYDTIFDDVSFQIDTKWKLGFCGRNGRGKTTFLKLLMGEFEYRGHITSDVSFDYFPLQIRDPNSGVLDILFEISPTSEECVDKQIIWHSISQIKRWCLYAKYHKSQII